jgi:hypothetical protein
MTALLLLLQAAAAQAPDIQLNADISARSVTIEQKGDARLTVTTSPDGGNVVDVRAPEAKEARTLRNVRVSVRAEARIADPLQPRDNNPDRPETTSPQ